MRLFVAVRLDEPVIEAAVSAARELQRRVGPSVAARWVSAGNMHLTVRFIGHVTDDRVTRVLEALRPALPIPPFDVALGAGGVFPRHGPPRVLWIGLVSGLPSLRAMHVELDRRLAPLGYEPETREFSAHLTLARIKEVQPGTSRSVREAAADVE